MTNIEELRTRVSDVRSRVDASAQSTLTEKPETTMSVELAKWHSHGLCYHADRLINHYNELASHVAAGIDSGTAARVIHSQAAPSLMYEFYALTNLAKIALDNLRYIIAPAYN